MEFFAKIQTQPSDMFYNKRRSQIFWRINWKAPVPETFFPATLLKKRLAQLFFCEGCKFFKGTSFFTQRHHRLLTVNYFRKNLCLGCVTRFSILVWPNFFLFVLCSFVCRRNNSQVLYRLFVLKTSSGNPCA